MQVKDKFLNGKIAYNSSKQAKLTVKYGVNTSDKVKGKPCLVKFYQRKPNAA